MISLQSCLEIIDRELEAFKAENKKPSELYDPVYYILSLGGKRIRPALVLMACNLFSEDVSNAVKPALAIEVFHNFTLVHDDIMDNAPIRRNKPTVHAKWDDNVAILSGDAMQILAYRLLCEGNPLILKKLLEVFNTTALEVCEGQQYDMNFASRNDVTLTEYIRMIELKTSVLLAASLKIGALCAGAPESEAQKLYEFGRNLGLAFQIQDDYLDVYANQEVFGKTTGGDIAENKKTFLLINALELAKEEQASALQIALNGEVTNITEKIMLVRNIYNQLGIPELTLDHIRTYTNEAFKYLDSVAIDSDRKNQLYILARDLMKRDH